MQGDHKEVRRLKHPCHGLSFVRFFTSQPEPRQQSVSRIISCRRTLVQIDAEASVDGQPCCSGKLSFMLIDNDKLNKE